MAEGETLRHARLARGLELESAAEALGVAPRVLRALEWDRRDLLPGGAADELERRYRRFLGLTREPREHGSTGPASAVEPRRLARVPLAAHVIPILAVLAAAAFALTAWRSGWTETGSHVNRPVAPSVSTAASTTTPAATTTTAPAVTSSVTTTEAAASAGPPKKPRIVVSATRGATWLTARAGSASGKVLFEGYLAQGRSLRYQLKRVWLRLGAAADVDVSVDGKLVGRALVGTVNVLVSRAGATPA